ncbi:MAG: hypothetical protein ABIW79_06355, partial [Gemmatimonas sp.]
MLRLLTCTLAATLAVAPVIAVAQAAKPIAKTGAKPVAAPFTTSLGEWPSYTGDTRGSRYSPLEQINATNFGTLEV